MDLEWMAWTRPTAIFIGLVVAMLATMTILGIRYPSPKVKRFLPIATNRGDRLYIGLIVTGFIHVAWLGFRDDPLWIATVIAAIWLFILFRWG